MGASGGDTKSYLKQWYDDIAFWRRLRTRVFRWRQEHPFNLFTASAMAITVLAVAAVGLWLVLGFVLGDNWPWQLANTDTSRFSVSRMVLFVLAGAVGVIGVVVAYRRQHSAEQSRFLERLAEASRLLGDQNPTIQAAGIYGLAGLADAESRVRRQQCVNVLCAYIRLPYAPAGRNGEPKALENVKRTRTLRTQTGPIEEERTLFRPHDRHTRETIIRVITQHLRSDAKVSWSDLSLDFTGAVLDYGAFTGAIFRGISSFQGAQFDAGIISFRDAQFASGSVDFGRARFTGGTVDFTSAQFIGGLVNFRNAEFAGGTVEFGVSSFIGGTVRFGNSRFMGGTVNFGSAEFAGSTIEFFASELIGGTVEFRASRFKSGTVDFMFSRFTDGLVDLTGAVVDGGLINYENAEFAGGTISFKGVRFKNGTVNFRNAKLIKGRINFALSKFSGGTVDFQETEFSGGTVDFRAPRTWSAPPLVPWGDGDEAPRGVMPRTWPPKRVG